MAMAGVMGADIVLPQGPAIPFLFGEDQGCYVIAAPKALAARVASEAARQNVYALHLGETGGRVLKLYSAEIDVAALKQAHQSWLPAYMGG